MKRPNKNTRVSFNVFKHVHGRQLINICGVIKYPLVIHRLEHEQTEIAEGVRKRYSGQWTITHLPTGMSCGIQGSWSYCKGFVEELGDHSVFLMVTTDTLTDHPDYSDLLDKYRAYKDRNGYR